MDFYETKCGEGNKLSACPGETNCKACAEYTFTDITQDVETREMHVRCADHWDDQTDSYLNITKGPEVEVTINNVLCTPGDQTECITPQGCSYTISCLDDNTWEDCPNDYYECTPGIYNCGNCGIRTCNDNCQWTSDCSGEGVCPKDTPNTPYCPCPDDGCAGSTYYDYPDYGDCNTYCGCEIGTDPGEPCAPIDVIHNDSRCSPSLDVELQVATDTENWSDSLVSPAPINGVDFKVDVLGTMTGTVTYKFDCTNDGTWEYTLEHLDITSPDSNWIERNGHLTKITESFLIQDVCDYSSVKTYTARVRVERGSGSAEETVTITARNNPPKAINLSYNTYPDNTKLHCFAKYPPVELSWSFEDPGDSQSVYQVQVADNADFSSIVEDSGEVLSSEGVYSPANLSFSTSYYWRVRVWDSFNTMSDCGYADGWCYPAGPFQTEAKYPLPDFEWFPQRPTAGEEIQFCSMKEGECSEMSDERKTILYNGEGTWEWDFNNDGIVDSTLKNPTYSYPEENPAGYTVSLKVTDGSGYGPCKVSYNISVREPLPEWRETPPF